MGRSASPSRKTNETEVSITLDLDGTGAHEINTGVPFLDHLLTHLTVHGLLDLNVQASGDLQIDEHHTVEDVAIVLGQALAQALGEGVGIRRMGHAFVPMDESLAFVAVDLSGRPYAVIDAPFDAAKIGALSTSLVSHFLETLASNAKMNVHARVFYGRDDHHKAEAVFKALGRALRDAVERDARRSGVPSTKGTR
ncbi:MAG: imidazoleglycerol-phosphate dehydratase HisB [Chloroflexi bacterium]|nr:imidazoleglycerol-phosphate dehydratase HisB [Chloroflexota bacterium]